MASMDAGPAGRQADTGPAPAQPPPTPEMPTTGCLVRYVGRYGIHAHRAAVVTMATDTWIRGGDVVPLSGPTSVHLWVYTPRTASAAAGGDPGYGQVSGFPEEDVPYDPAGAPGTWHWPVR